MLINPADKSDMTMRFRRAPQGKLARVFDWVGVVSLIVSTLALLLHFYTDDFALEGVSIRTCLFTLNVAIVTFILARVVELVDRLIRLSDRDHQ